MDNWEIVVKPYGRITVGRLYENGKLVRTERAKKHPDDEYDMELGVKLTVDRLLRPTYYSGKVVCIDNQHNEHIYKVGKIYEFKDGWLLKNDSGFQTSKRICSFEEFCNRTLSKFIEVIE